MNYRHAFHAGNFADVLKHLVLTLCVEHLKKKDRPFAVIDTHAGIGRYDLTSDAALRSPEWKDGIGRILDAEMPSEAGGVLGPWLDAVRAINGPGALTTYPGSPALAAHLARRADRLHLCELHEQDAKTLDRLFAKDGRVKVEKRDGYKALKAVVPPREKRGLVLVDPPFEHRDEMAHMAKAAMDGLSRWPGGTFIFWRPLKDLWAQERFDVGLAEWLFEEHDLKPEHILRADLWVRDLDAEGRLAGAGVVVVNPPFTLEADLLAVMDWLCATLKQGDGAGWRVDGAIAPDSLSVDEF
jgi:23S rRNA (adenine2030-N6)-methyltransferase